jgi:hypothetical protein
VFETDSGRLVATLPAVQDADDMYHDSARKRVYIPGAEKDTSACFSRKMPITKSFSPKSIPLWEHVLLGTSERAEKDLIASTLPSQLVPIMAMEVWIFTVQD